MVKKFFRRCLGVAAKIILYKYQPRVIAITGSVGKTGTREALRLALSGSFAVRQNKKNYNTEVGVPATVLGVEPPGKNVLAWLSATLAFLRLFLFPAKYPDVLILELGMDKPGDISYLMNMIKPDIGILTAIGSLTPVHRAFFATTEELIHEKGNVITMLPQGGYGVVNADDERSVLASMDAQCTLEKVGKRENATCILSNIVRKNTLSVSDGKVRGGGIEFTVTLDKEVYHVSLPYAIAEHHAYAVAQVLAAGNRLGVTPASMIKRLEDFKTPPGRLRLLLGIKKSVLLDDSYNAAPEATRAAVELLSDLKYTRDSRRVVVLGHFAELGDDEAAKEHYNIAELVARKADIFIGVGTGIKDFYDGAHDAGMRDSHMRFFETSEEAAEFIKEAVEENDLILIKGSQNSRMEKITKALLAKPERAGEVLVRQDWKA